jgi:4-amino-4-deoxychorismate mutase
MSGLEPFRQRLDELDEQIVELLGERFSTCREIAIYKRDNEIPMMQPERVVQVRLRYLTRGAHAGLPSDFAEALAGAHQVAQRLEPGRRHHDCTQRAGRVQPGEL